MHYGRVTCNRVVAPSEGVVYRGAPVQPSPNQVRPGTRTDSSAGRDRPRRDCCHEGTPHRHGTRVAYVRDFCRCLACTAANTAASRTRYRHQAIGRWQPFVDAGAVREHLSALRAAGIGVERIARLTGLSLSHIRTLASTRLDGSPPTRKVRPDTAARVLAIQPSPATRAPRSRVPALGTRRRLQALARLGWSLAQQADQLSRRPASLRRSMASDTVTADTAHAVAVLYARLETTGPPELTAEQRAAADAVRREALPHGWPPPLAWDDIDTDPAPPATPPAATKHDIDDIAIERAIAGDGVTYDQLTSDEQQTVVEVLTDRGQSLRGIAAQLRTTKRTVSRRRACSSNEPVI
jgi:hypothetical protein